MAERKLPLLRWVAEFVLIVGSVYLAVYLEGQSQDVENREAARTALTQLLSELNEDLLDFDRIIDHQSMLDEDYTNLRRWLTGSVAPPTDSLRDALYRVSTENSTLFPRKASWTTMVSGGQLADLAAPELVLTLAQLYETIYARIDYNGNNFDEALNDGYVSNRGIRWQTLDGAPLSPDPDQVQELASFLEWLHVTWNLWYRDMLVDYRVEVAEAIIAVEAYLGADG